MTPKFFDNKTPPHIVTLVLMAGISSISMNIFLPSLPAMTAWFKTDYATMQLAISGYLAGYAILQLIIGPLSDRYGRRPVLLACLCIYILATLGCILSTRVEVFLAFRFAQTVVISGIVLSRAIIRDMVPMEQAASLIGYVTMSMALLPMVGPIIGGALNDLFGWQANFITLLVAAILILVVMVVDLGETNKTKTANFRSQFAAWPELYQSKKFWGFSLTATFGAGAYYSFLGGAPFVGATLLHLSPSALGFQFAICTIGYIIGNFISGRFSTRFGINAMMIAGGAVCTFGVLLTMAIESVGALTPLTFFGPLSLVGVGNGLGLPSANAGIVSVRPHLAGSASGLGGFINFASNSALSVLAGSVLSVEAGAMPLLLVMLGTCVLSVLAPIYVWSLDRKDSAVEGATTQ